MFTVISGTNRSGSTTRKVSGAVVCKLQELDCPNELLDLVDLPREIFHPSSYKEKPAGFAPWQQAIYNTQGLLMVIPEYNGSFPGVLKYFIDMLKFPESLVGKPVAFIGVAAGHYGASRAVDQMTAVVQYRSANIYGRRILIHESYSLKVEGKSLGNDAFQERFENLVEGFVAFSRALGS